MSRKRNVNDPAPLTTIQHFFSSLHSCCIGEGEWVRKDKGTWWRPVFTTLHQEETVGCGCGL